MKQKSRSLVLLFLALMISVFLGGGIAYAADDIGDLQTKSNKDNVTQEQVQDVQDVQPSEQPSEPADELISTPKAKKAIESLSGVQESMNMEQGLADARKYLSKPIQNITKVVMMVVAAVFAWITICMIFDCLRIATGWDLWRNGLSLGGGNGGSGQNGGGKGFTVRLSLEKGSGSGNSGGGGGGGAATVGDYIKSHLKIFIPTLVLLGLIVTGQYLDICIMVVEYIVKGINWLWGLIKPIVDGFFG